MQWTCGSSWVLQLTINMLLRRLCYCVLCGFGYCWPRAFMVAKLSTKLILRVIFCCNQLIAPNGVDLGCFYRCTLQIGWCVFPMLILYCLAGSWQVDTESGMCGSRSRHIVDWPLCTALLSWFGSIDQCPSGSCGGRSTLFLAPLGRGVERPQSRSAWLCEYLQWWIGELLRGYSVLATMIMDFQNILIQDWLTERTSR